MRAGKGAKRQFSVPLIAGCAVLAGLVVAALLAPAIVPYDPAAQNLSRSLEAPSLEHWMGLDRLGRDILSRIIYGSRVSLAVGFSVVTLSLGFGVFIGSAAGLAGRLVDEAVMRVIDVLQAFPGILLAIALTAVLGPSLQNVILSLCALGWVGYARLVRGQILAVRQMEFVEAARAMGAGVLRLGGRHILPNILAPIIVEATFGMAAAITAEAGLSFLGLGVQPPTPSWGTMLAEGRQVMLVSGHLTVFPGLAIAVVVLGLNFLGDALRDLLDVRAEA